MDIKEIIQILGLAEDATEEDVRTALKAGAQAIDDLAAERARAEASEDNAKAAKGEADTAKAALDNEKKAHAATKTALANEKAARADMALDAAVKERRIGETARETWKTRLVNEGDAAYTALANEKAPSTTDKAKGPANERDGSTYIVGTIASIGLVNNPNIPEFRLANEEQPTIKIKLNPAIIELAAKYDQAREAAHTEAQRHGELANSTDANGREHVEAGSPEGGQFAPKTEGVKLRPSEQYQSDPEWHDVSTRGKIFYPSERQVELGMKADATSNRASALHNINKLLERSRTDYHNATIEKKRVRHDAFLKEAGTAEQRVALRDRASLHRVAILQGFSYNAKTHQYE